MADTGKSVFDLDANLVVLLCYIGNFIGNFAEKYV